MTKAQIQLVKKSWSIFRDIDPQLVGDVFYSRLFLKAPALKKMFPTSMREQYKKLTDMLSMIVSRLERMDELTGEIKDLAIRHTQYGVKPWHFELVGEALLWTLEKGSGKDWTHELKEAWTTCYTILADSMISAADPERIKA